MEILPEDAERAVHYMLPETIEENMKKQRVFSGAYTGRDNSGQSVRRQLQTILLDKIEVSI